MEWIGHLGMAMFLFVAEFVYSVVQQASVDLDLTPAQDLDPVLEPIWAQGSLDTTNPLDLVFPSDEAILEELTSPDKPWVDLHHRSYFFPELRRIEAGEFVSTVNGNRSCPINPLAMHAVYVEGNMASIIEMIPIDISRTPGIVENVFFGADCSPKEIQIYTDLFKESCDVFSCSYKEMSRIDPRIVKHEITTYPDTKSIWQKICSVNPRKVAEIKVDVEKLLKSGFIFLVQMTEWVSNPVLVNKKQGVIRVCMDLCDLKKAII
jgi:hypothetical protein